MHLNLKRLFDRDEQAATLTTKQYLALTLPPPYNITAQINISNYHSQIEYICKRKNVPFELQQFIISSFEKNIRKEAKIQGIESHKKDYSVVRTNTSTISQLTKRTDSNITIVDNFSLTEPDEPKIYERHKNIVQAQKLDLASAVYRQKAEEAIKEQPKTVRKANPKVFNKLYAQHKCGKSICIKKQMAKQAQEGTNIDDLINIKEKPTLTKRTIEISNSMPDRKENIYQRLYRDSIRRHEDHAQKVQSLMSSFEEQRRPQIRHESLYLKNYRPFFQRIQEQIKQRRQKQKFFQSLKLDLTTKQELFKPKINKSSVKPRVYEYLNKSMEIYPINEHIRQPDVMNKSTQLIRQRQERCLKSISDRLFQDNRIIFNAETIENLTDQQFQILYPFLTRGDNNKSTKSQFDQKFQKYFNTLNVMEKHKLKYGEQCTVRCVHVAQSVKKNLTFKPRINKRSEYLSKQVDYQKILDFV